MPSRHAVSVDPLAETAGCPGHRPERSFIGAAKAQSPPADADAPRSLKQRFAKSIRMFRRTHLCRRVARLRTHHAHRGIALRQACRGLPRASPQESRPCLLETQPWPCSHNRGCRIPACGSSGNSCGCPNPNRDCSSHNRGCTIHNRVRSSNNRGCAAMPVAAGNTTVFAADTTVTARDTTVAAGTTTVAARATTVDARDTTVEIGGMVVSIGSLRVSAGIPSGRHRRSAIHARSTTRSDRTPGVGTALQGVDAHGIRPSGDMRPLS